MITGVNARYFLDLLLMSAIIKSLPFFFFFYFLFNRLDTFLICLPLPNPVLRSKLRLNMIR